MKIPGSHAASISLSTIWHALLCFTLLLGGSLIAANVSATDAVSVNVSQHSVSVKVGVDGQARISSQSSSETHDEDTDHDSDSADRNDDQHDQDSHHDDTSHQDIVQVFGDSTLQAGQKANNVVSVMGSSTNDGDAAQNVVSVLGNTRVTGTVGQNAVAVLGNNYVNNKVGQNVVAVLGDVELGPQADVGQNVVVVGGTVKRDPGAKVSGGVQQIGPSMGGFEWLRSWLHNCLFKFRLLAFDAGVMWAWWIALIALLAYVLTAMLFPRPVDRCVEVMEQHPGHVVLAALLTTVGVPIVMVLLCITIIGIIAIPFVGMALLIAGFFGKVVILAWIGRRLIKKTESGMSSQPAVAVIVGGVLVLLLYVVPVLSFILYKVIGFLGLGVAMYALLLEIKSRREIKNGNHPGSSGAASAADLADKGNVAGSTETPQADLSSASTVSAVTLNALPSAGFGVRMVALLVDAVLLGAIIHMCSLPSWMGGGEHFLQKLFVMLAIYGAIMWKLKGATVGDIVFKLQVVRIDNRPIDWATAIVRGLGCFLSLIAIGLGFFWIAFDEHKQGWHDKIAGTLVVHNPKGMSLV